MSEEKLNWHLRNYVHINVLNQVRTELDKTKAALDVAVKALEFYANSEYVDVKNRYLAVGYESVHEEVAEDDGTIAKNAVKEIKAILAKGEK